MRYRVTSTDEKQEANTVQIVSDKLIIREHCAIFVDNNNTIIYVVPVDKLIDISSM